MQNEKITAELQNLLKNLFKEGDLIISYKESGIPGQMTPFFIRSKDKIDLIKINQFCVNNLSVYLSELTLIELFGNKPNAKLIITVKPCDVNSVLQMISDAQIPVEKVTLIVFECNGIIAIKDIKESIQDDFITIECKEDSLQLKTMQNKDLTLNSGEFLLNKCKEGSQCHIPSYHGYYFVGKEKKKPVKVSKTKKDETLVQDSLTRSELKKLVDAELSRCIRCNECRNICPACFCSDQCVMDKPKLVAPFIEKGTKLSNNILYHLIRFYHVAPNCTACSECERVCPQNIKLSIFYKYLHRFTEQELGYIPGKTDQERQKLLNYRFGEDLV